MSYASVALLFLGLAVLVAIAAAVVARPSRRWWTGIALVAVALLVLTAIFDSLMIAADLFRFDESQLLGVHVILAPLEDFAWPLASALALPALWHLLGTRDTRTRRNRARARADREPRDGS
jgi:lycopene cyclase domain-containing protein